MYLHSFANHFLFLYVFISIDLWIAIASLSMVFVYLKKLNPTKPELAH